MSEKNELGLPWHSIYASVIDDGGRERGESPCGVNTYQAEFILKAVNNHHALVEALELCLSDLDAMPMSLGFKYTSTREAHRLLESIK